MFPAILGLLGGSSAITGAATSLLGGGAAGLVKDFVSGGGLFGVMSKLFGGPGGPGGKPAQDAMALMGDLGKMLGHCVDSMGPQGGGCHGGDASHRAGHGNGSHGGCGGASGGESGHKPGGSCGSEGSGSAGWDGKDKSPSLDRERGAKRLLEQAKNTDDPEQKRELIKMALDMLGEGGGADGNSYDRDIVKQAEKMLESIDNSNLNDRNASKAMDSVIDMLTKEGGVDGKPAGNGHDGASGSESEHKPGGSCGAEGAGSADGAEWDGEDKSPSLDREQGAKRLLEQAKNTDDPEQKRELIKMALDMLGEGGDCGCDGNSYDKDIVDHAEKMLESIDDSNLNDCNASKAMDSVIDMLMEEGGVDGKPAGNDHDGDGWRDYGESRGGGLWHVLDHHTMHR